MLEEFAGWIMVRTEESERGLQLCLGVGEGHSGRRSQSKSCVTSRGTCKSMLLIYFHRPSHLLGGTESHSKARKG